MASRVQSAAAQYPSRAGVDFTQLREQALRRYLAFHGVAAPVGSSREQLAVLVARHFVEASQHADEAASISTFVSFISQKDPEGVHKRRKIAADKRAHVRASVHHGPRLDDAVDQALMELRAQDDDRPNNVLVDIAAARAIEHRTSDEFDDLAMEPSSFELDGDNDSFDEANDTPEVQHRSGRRAGRGGSKHTTSRRSGAHSSSTSAGTNAIKKKKVGRKPRLYCVCKGSSFGDMIACDSKKCLDRSNWYHMSCVGLNPAKPPPDTWYCPQCRGKDMDDIPENQYRKPVASVTYGDMISHALTALPEGKGTFKEICDFVEKEYESQLNWKLESDQRKSPVWKSSVRKILFSNMRFRKHPEDKGNFCLAA